MDKSSMLEEAGQKNMTSTVDGKDGNLTSGNTTAGGSESTYPGLSIHITMWVGPLLVMSLNMMVFVIIPRMKSFRRCTAYCMLSLGVTDFSLGGLELMKVVYNTYIDFTLTDTDPVCTVLGYGNALFGGVSILTLTFMNIDRLVIVLKPLSYTRYFNILRIKVILVSFWVSMAALLAPTLSGAFGTRFRLFPQLADCVVDLAGNITNGVITLVLLFIIPGVVNVSCSIYIFHVARSSRRTLRRQSSVQVHQGTTTTSGATQWQKDVRIFRSLALMTFGFYLCWTPYFALVGIPLIFTGRSLGSLAEVITAFLAFFNSLWNPIIYILTLRPFKDAMTDLWHSCTARTTEDTAGGT